MQQLMTIALSLWSQLDHHQVHHHVLPYLPGLWVHLASARYIHVLYTCMPQVLRDRLTNQLLPFYGATYAYMRMLFDAQRSSPGPLT